MTLFLYAVLWLWYWLRPRQRPQSPATVTVHLDNRHAGFSPTKPEPLPVDFLTEARKTHPREMEAVDFASWELQMETEEW